MVEHAWFLENIAVYNAGGLDTSERAQFQEHRDRCGDCAKAMEEAQGLDRTLAELFATARPRPGLEDRLIRKLRATPRQGPLFDSPFAKFLVGVAAMLFLGLVGAGMIAVSEGAEMLSARAPQVGFGGALDTSASKALGETGIAFHNYHEKNLEAEDIGGEGRWSEGWKDGERSARGEPAMRTASELADETRRTALGVDWGRYDGKPNAGKRTMAVAEAQVEELSVPGSKAEPRPEKVPPPPGYNGQPGAGGGINQGPGKDKEADYSKKIADGKENTGYYTYRNADPNSPVSASSATIMTVNELAKESKGESGRSAGGTGYFKPGEGRPVAGEPAKPAPTSPAPDAKPEEKRADKDKDDRSVKGNEGGQQPKKEPAPADPAPPVAQRKIIRIGDMEFEVDNYEAASDKITKIAGEERGFVATANSEKLPNGKMRGTITVRLPPEKLDTFVLKLRALGELRNQKITSQDVTKHYTDTESRLRAARTTETRLLEIIKTGKGEIKDLVIAEKELAVIHTKIEEMEGELRYYNNLISLSTLNITLTEKEIRTAFGITETEKVEIGIEVEDVEKGQREAHAAITEAKGRITKSELKQHAAGQFQAVIHFEASPETAGALRDRLKQLGEVTRLDVGRVQQVEGGSTRPQDNKVKREDVQFFLSLYNVANVAPRETVQLNLACGDAEDAYKSILAKIAKSGGRVVNHNLDRQRNDQIRGTINFEIKTADANEVLDFLKAAGEVMRLHVVENADTQNITKSKRGFQLQVWALATVMPRETTVIQMASQDVPGGYRKLLDAMPACKGRVLNARLNEQDRQNITADLDVEVPRAQQKTLAAALADTGVVLTRNVMRAQESDNLVDSKERLQLTILNVANIKPRETMTLGIEVTDVEKTAAALAALVKENKGRSVESHVSRRPSGEMVAKLVYDVPLAQAQTLTNKLNAAGTVRSQNATRNQQVPESELAIARFDVVLSNEPLVGDEGMGSAIKKGLKYSFVALYYGLMLVVIGLMFVLPFASLYGGYRLVQRVRNKPEETPPAA